ncbi:MAG: FtsX-like permease family protein [Pyrinomonadaceae bacterium]
MPYEIFLALRYLGARRAKSVRVTALAALVGVACGVAALVVAAALANGFRDEMRDKILSGTAHITVARADAQPVSDWRALAARLRAVEGVTDAAPTSYAGALLEGSDGTAYAVVRAVDQSSARELAQIRRTLTSGAVESLFQSAPPQTDETRREETSTRADRIASRRADEKAAGRTDEGSSGRGASRGAADDEPPASVVIGAELASRAGLRMVGDEGWLVFGEKTEEEPGFATRARRVRVAGIFRSGLYEYDATWVYATLGESARLSGADADGAPVLSVETADIFHTPETAARIRRALGSEFAVVDWQEANRPLFAALALERRTVSFVIALVMIVAALNITTTLVLVVAERRADIAILGAMGARPVSVMLVFVCEGAIIGALGSVSGVALGLLSCLVGDRYKLVSLPADVYSLSSIPFHPRAGETLLAALLAFAVCLVATIYPARAAARLRPAEALRYE